jgi:3-methylfumaryl-CoA hydratase
MSTINIEHLKRWIGRRETTTDTLVESQAERLALTLDHAQSPRAGDLLPPLWHWIYFTPRAPRYKIGSDGHPKLGDFMPPCRCRVACGREDG